MSGTCETLIANLREEQEEESDEHLINSEDLPTTICDMSISRNTRMKAFSMILERTDEEIIEACNRLSGIYIFSKSSLAEQFIYDICMGTDLMLDVKILLGKALCTHGEEFGYKVLDSICQDFGDLAVTLRVDTIKELFWSETYVVKGVEYLCKIVNDPETDIDYRYRTILGLENDKITEPEDDEDRDKNSIISAVIDDVMLNFFRCETNDISKRVLAAQYILKDVENADKRQEIENGILELASSDDVEYNVRADAADVLLQYGTFTVEPARAIIMELGAIDGGPRTVFSDAQNVHYTEFEQSFNEGIEFLSSIPIMKIDGEIITFEYTRSKVEDLMDEYLDTEGEKEKMDKINISLNRIHMDRALYSKFRCSLVTILLRVWTYMSAHECHEEMSKRMLQELEDMSGLCSSGLAERLVNIISGFGDFNYRMSWRDQIVANFVGRLNARARSIQETWRTPERIMKILKLELNSSEELMKRVILRHIKTKRLTSYKFPEGDSQESAREYNLAIARLKSNGKFPNETDLLSAYKKLDHTEGTMVEDFQGACLEEMAVDTSKHEDRRHFLLFFGETVLDIREEMYEEFKEHIEDAEFDMYIRNAISMYETGAN